MFERRNSHFTMPELAGPRGSCGAPSSVMGNHSSPLRGIGSLYTRSGENQMSPAMVMGRWRGVAAPAPPGCALPWFPGILQVGARHETRPWEEASHMGREGSAVEDRAMPTVDAARFKSALASFATGVTLATTLADGEPHGITANAIMSVSLDPPLVALSIQQGTRMHAALQRADNFALSVLAAEHAEVARYFSDSTRPHDAAAFIQFPCRPAV